ncbi:MAG: amidohydrolase family protein [Anaerolineales bacterium]|nr:amidohydrolase family protein [Anaerolineales bacterium]
MDTPIYNCHIHTFTADHVVPAKFRRLVKAVRIPWLRLILLQIIGRLVFRMSKDSVILTNRFFARGALESQQNIFEHVQKQYPDKTRFIALPMDLEFMGIGKPISSYESQLQGLAKLRDENKNTLIPFSAVDPRRPNVVNEFKRWHKEYKIKGLKIYPNLGYYPDNPVLMEVYEYCEKNHLPVMAHCSPGGIRKIGISIEEAREFANPANYKKVLEQFPKLHLCLAHFGGSEEWERHLTGGTPREGKDATWLTIIIDMLREKKANSSARKYPNLYTDVSYTLFTETPSYRPFNYINFLNVLLEDKAIRERVIFGTDYYMVEREKVSEMEVSIGMRAHLGEKLYFQIAHYNTRRYLYESDKNSATSKSRKTKIKQK